MFFKKIYCRSVWFILEARKIKCYDRFRKDYETLTVVWDCEFIKANEFVNSLSSCYTAMILILKIKFSSFLVYGLFLINIREVFAHFICTAAFILYTNTIC